MPKTSQEIFTLFQNLHTKIQKIKQNSQYPEDDNRNHIFGVLDSQIVFLTMIFHILDSQHMAQKEPKQMDPMLFHAVVGMSAYEPWVETELQVISKMSFITMCNFMIENFFKTLLSKSTTNNTTGYYNILKEICNLSQISDVEQKSNVIYTLALYRNAMHNNGIHLPTHSTWNDFSITLGNSSFVFSKGRKTGIFFSDLVILLDNIVDILDEIVNAQEIKNISEKIPLTLENIQEQ